MCKRIRQQWPGLKILVGRWGDRHKNEHMEKRLRNAGADQVVWTLRASRTQIVPLLLVAANAAPDNSGKSELVTTP